MIVKVYEIDRDTGAEFFLRHSQLGDVEMFGDSIHGVANELSISGRAWIGGGNNRLFYLVRVVQA